MKLPIIPADKANHIAYGAALACVGAFHSVLAGAALCAIFAVGKEVVDLIRGTGTPDYADALATAVGGAFVVAPLAAWRLGVFA